MENYQKPEENRQYLTPAEIEAGDEERVRRIQLEFAAAHSPDASYITRPTSRIDLSLITFGEIDVAELKSRH